MATIKVGYILLKTQSQGIIVLVAIIVISRNVFSKKHNVATVQRCIMKLFRTIYLFFDGNYKANADLMIGDMTDDGDDDKFHQHVIKHAKGFGECALLGCKFS